MQYKNKKQFFVDYFSMISETKYKRIHGERIKLLTPKQLLQILSIALAQSKSR